MKKIPLCALLLLSTGIAAAQETDKKPPVAITPHVDKTAIWIGDEIRYTIRAVYDANVEMVLDNFTKERLQLAPFVVRDITIERKEWAGDKGAVEITLTLTTFETGKTDLTIPLVPLYYFVRETGLAEKEKPVDSVAAAPVPIGLRSALVTESLIPRTTTAPPSPGMAWALVPFAIGFAGLLSLGTYGGWRTWQRLYPTQAITGLSREQREEIVRNALTRLRADVAAAGEDVRRWSGAMASTLRVMAGQLFDIPGAAQTPDEIEASLKHAGADASLATQTKTVLARCDELRYGKEGASGPRMKAQLLDAAERLMQSPRWISA